MRKATFVAGAWVVLALSSPLAAQEIGDPVAGEKVFKRCMACHAIGAGAANKVGRELNGIIGEKPGDVEGFRFSPDLVTWGEGKVWNAELMAQWLQNPKAVVPKTKMIFPGIKKEQELKDITAYIAGFDESGAPRDPAEALKAAEAN